MMRNDAGTGTGKGARAALWQIIRIPEDLWIRYEVDAPEDTDPSGDREIRLSIGYPEFLRLAMPPDTAEEMIFALQRALETAAATGPPAGE